jgi:hypothetical protein
MTSQDIALRRLFSQQITGGRFTEPAGLVQWMGCIRAEDFTGAKWTIGHRVGGSTDDSIERAFNQGLILRTHVMTPAWHFIAREDIHWMLALTAQRLKLFYKGLHRTLGVDDELLKKSKRIMATELEEGQMTRLQLRKVLGQHNIHTDDLRLGLLLMDAELDGLVCSGSRDGRQFTYALLEERAPLMTRRYDKAESIAELARRYFLSRGPATLPDFTLWSGLRLTEASAGIEMNKRWLTSEVINGQAYWFDPSCKISDHDHSLFLLPAFDELAVAYTNNGIFKPAVIIDGQVAGTWTRVLGKGTVSIDVTTPLKKDRALNAGIREEAARYSTFLGRRLLL